MKIDFLNQRQYTWVAVAGAAVTVGTGIYKGAQAKKQAKKLAANRPTLEASPYLNEQIGLAESELSNGVSARSEQMYNNSSDRALSSGLNAILQGGGSINNVSELFDSSDQGRQRFAMMNDNLRLQQINNLARAQGGSEGFRQTQFEFNQWKPWADQSQAASEARRGAAQMVNNGINTAGGALIGYAGRNNLPTSGTQPAAANSGTSQGPSASAYLPQQAGGIYSQFPQAPMNAPNMQMNYNSNPAGAMNYPPFTNVYTPVQPITPWGQ